MAWQQSIHDVRRAHLRASQAELSREWHMATHHYLYCLEQSQVACDLRAERFFAGKLSHAYRAMGLANKASYYRSLAH